jgi:1-aminocyclopropane-1-carboxylate deaminase
MKSVLCNGNSGWKWELITEYHFGGYGKVTQEWVLWKNKIPLDPIYTGKMILALWIATNYFPAESKILLIHTGGIQELKGWIHDYEKTITNN